MGDIVRLRFKVHLSKVSIRIGDVERILAEDHCEYLRRVDPDLAEWLDRHSPRWGVEHNPVGYVVRDLPIGPDEQGAFIAHDRYLTFEFRDQAEACVRRLAEVAGDLDRKRSTRSTLRPDVAERCDDCHGPMEEGTSRIDFRCGPILFFSNVPCHRCPECCEEMIRLSDGRFSELALGEVAGWIDEGQRREARHQSAIAEINVPHNADRKFLRTLVTPVMESWIGAHGAADADPFPGHRKGEVL